MHCGNGFFTCGVIDVALRKQMFQNWGHIEERYFSLSLCLCVSLSFSVSLSCFPCWDFVHNRQTRPFSERREIKGWDEPGNHRGGNTGRMNESIEGKSGIDGFL